MAKKDVLSQEEIDALLQSVGDNSAEAEESAEAVEAAPEGKVEEAKEPPRIKEEIQVVNFGSQERNFRGELPVLEKIHDRVTRFFVQDIYLLMARELSISQQPLQLMKHKAFFQSLASPVMMTLVQLRPLRGKALLYFDSTFVYDIVDYYFGGNSHFTVNNARTDFTATENRVMDIVIKKLMKNFEQAWAPIMPMNVSRISDETNPQMVHISESQETLLISHFEVNFGKEKGHYGFVLPYLMVEPIKQQLELGAARPDEEIDPNWVHSLTDELMEVPLEVSAYMAQSRSSLREVLDLKTGDFLAMEQRDIITLDIEGTPSFVVSMGSAGDKLALQVQERIHY